MNTIIKYSCDLHAHYHSAVWHTLSNPKRLQHKRIAPFSFRHFLHCADLEAWVSCIHRHNTSWATLGTVCDKRQLSLCIHRHSTSWATSGRIEAVRSCSQFKYEKKTWILQ